MSSSVLSGHHLLDNATTRRQHLANLRRVLTTRFCEVRPSTTATTNNRRELLHDLTCGDLLREIGRDADDDRHLAVRRRGKDDDSAFDLTAVLIDECAQAVLVEA